MDKKDLYWHYFIDETPKDNEVILVRGEMENNGHSDEFYVFLYDDGKLCSCTTGKPIGKGDRFDTYTFTHWAYIPRPDFEPIKQPKPFDKVLVRSCDSDIWIASLVSHIFKDKGTTYCRTVSGEVYKYFIEYEGNESLVGTKELPF